jgi:hypothetical protein
MYKLNKIYSNEIEKKKFNNVNNQSILDNKEDLQLLVEWFKKTKELTISKDLYRLKCLYTSFETSLLMYDDMNAVKEIEKVYYHIISIFSRIGNRTPSGHNAKIPIHTLTVRVKCVTINTVLKIFGVKSVKKILNIPKKNIRNSTNLQEIVELIGIDTLYFSWSEFMTLNTTENSIIYTHMNKFNSLIEHFRYRHTYFY